MDDSLSIPTFAIVGHPNEGKSSVVATLAEDDQVRISAMPGETLVSRPYPVRLSGEELIRFVDTPGFQHPVKMLEWMRQQPEATSNLPAAFIAAHQDQPEFLQDQELLKPLAEGSGIIYVVDGSRPLRNHDHAEMEIFRLTGNPRMAVINPKADESRYLEDWKQACAKCFNSTRIFNALHATYAERLSLLDCLKSIHQDWETSLVRVIEAFEEDWARRNAGVAGIICDLLRTSLAHVESRNVFHPQDEPAAKSGLVNQYQAAITRQEERAQAEIRRLFKHNIFKLSIPRQSILSADLFTEKTWQLLGLSRKQIYLAAAALGAGAGLNLDLILGHLSFGIFTLGGAAIGVGAAFFKGENMARASVKQLKLGGVKISVGPNQNPQFPFVLLDRLLLYYRDTINWTHARRDQPVPTLVEGAEQKLGFTAGWSAQRRKICLNYIRTLTTSGSRKSDEAHRKFFDMLQTVLMEISLQRNL